MRQEMLIGIVAAALSMGNPSEATAKSALDRATQLALQQHEQTGGYKLQPASFAIQPEVEAQPASTDTLPKDPDERPRSAAYAWEVTYLGLSAIDAVETISCLDRGTCTEHNPIWGRHPSTAKIVATKLGLGLVHFGIFKLISNRDPHSAMRVAQVSAAVQGGVVLLNLHHAF